MKLGITMLIQNKDDFEFVTEFPCLLGHPEINFHLNQKEFSLCHKFEFSNPYIFAIKSSRPIFQTRISTRSYNLSLQYERCTSSGCKD